MMLLNEQDQEKVFSSIANVVLKGSPQDAEKYMFIGVPSCMFRFECVDGSCLDFSSFRASAPFYVLDGTLVFDADYDTSVHIQETYTSLAKKYFIN